MHSNKFWIQFILTGHSTRKPVTYLLGTYHGNPWAWTGGDLFRSTWRHRKVRQSKPFKRTPFHSSGSFSRGDLNFSVRGIPLRGRQSWLVSNWTKTSCQPHRVTSVRSDSAISKFRCQNSSLKQILICKRFPKWDLRTKSLGTQI